MNSITKQGKDSIPAKKFFFKYKYTLTIFFNIFNNALIIQIELVENFWCFSKGLGKNIPVSETWS